MSKTSQEIMNGCGKVYFLGEDSWHKITAKCGEYDKIYETHFLCPTCQAQKSERAECYKKELERWQELLFAKEDMEIPSVNYGFHKSQEAISWLKQEIKILEGKK